MPGPGNSGDISSSSSSESAKQTELQEFKAEWMIPFDELQLIKKIGQGAFGVVYNGRWRNANVAIKQAKAITLDAEAMDEFKREALLQLNLRPHPNCVQTLGFSNHDSSMYVVMEWCRLGSLDALVKTGTLSLDEKLGIILGATSGLLHLHKSGIVHRDIAARNILVGEGQVAKISDFGMSRMLDKFETTGTTNSNVGPVRWMAPESLRSREYSPASDTWMWANTVVEIFAEKLPFADVDLLEVAVKVRKEGAAPEVPDTCPDWLADILERCWVMDPKARPSIADITSELQRRVEDAPNDKADT